MSNVKVTLSGEAADRLLRLVAEQKYARPEEAIEDALDALEESRASDLDAWLRDVVAARADALASDPSRALSAEEVRTRLLKA